MGGGYPPPYLFSISFMLINTLKTITLGTTILASTFVTTNNVTYDLTNKVRTTENTDVYREEKPTNYGHLYTWQFVNIEKTTETESADFYRLSCYTIYKIDNQNNLPMQLESQFIWANGTNQNTTFYTYITQLTSQGITQTKADEYINYTTDQLIANLSTIKTNLDYGISTNTTNYSRPLYYKAQVNQLYQTKIEDINKTTNDPTNERVIYILAKVTTLAQYNKLMTQEPLNKDLFKQTRLTQLNVISTVTIADGSYEVIDIGGLMLQILSMPWSFISTAFNVTLFPGTPYTINVANLAKGIIGICAVLFIVSLFTKGFSAIGSYIDTSRTSKLQKEQIKGMKVNNARNQIKLDQESKKSYNITENGKPFKPKD